jgi:hypothetical protein
MRCLNQGSNCKTNAQKIANMNISESALARYTFRTLALQVFTFVELDGSKIS